MSYPKEALGKHHILKSIGLLSVSFVLALAVLPSGQAPSGASANKLLDKLKSPVLFWGDATTAYRDPAGVYANGWFYLYFSLVKIESNGQVFAYTAWSKSRDLADWTKPRIFTPRDNRLNYSGPGDVVRFSDEWVLCLQTYPRPNGEKYANDTARIWTMRSNDLEHWGPAELLRVKGPGVPVGKMGRMIDPFLFADKGELGKWWCFFKQHGVIRRSWSRDLTTWTYAGSVTAGENPCVIVVGNEYVMFYSPKNGIGVMQSPDLVNWRHAGLITLGQRNWDWARGRLTAGFVLDARRVPGIGKYLMFFHGSRFSENDPRGGFDNYASIGLAWSDDLKEWDWPGKR